MNKLVKYIIESRFNFNIDQLEDIDNEGEYSLSKQQYKSKSMKREYIENNLFVDLGFPSRILWCKYNLGCDFDLLFSNTESTSPKDWYGKYYAWGEIKPKNNYTWKTYKYIKNDNLTKYCSNPDCGYERFIDDLTELLPEDDVAYQTNFNWRMPTKEQCQELIDYTDSRWISGRNNNLYMNVKGLRGRLFTSKINGNEIFIPATGRIYESSLNYDGSYCYLQTSSLNVDHPGFAWDMYFYPDGIGIGYGGRHYGRIVRPVYQAPQ